MSEPPRKKLRKGTKSCLECRRRKVRCTWDDGQGQPPCDGCIARETTCESQEQVSDLGQIREPTRDRVDRLEAIVKGLSEAVSELQKSMKGGSSKEAQHSSYALKDFHQDDDAESDYVDSVQDDDDDQNCNTCDQRAMPSRLRSFINYGSNAEHGFGDSTPDRTRASLVASVPSRGDLLVLTASSVDWWSIHKALMPDPPIKSRVDLIAHHEDLFKSSTHTAFLGTWLLCLAITFMQLPSSFDFSTLESVPEPSQFVSRTVRQVEELLTHEEIASTVEGIECATVFAQIQKFMGRPKKGWVVLRQALSYAELLNLHSSRKALQQLRKNGEGGAQLELLQRRANLWNSLCALDRLLCLLLGLPTAINDNTFTPDIDPNDPNASTRRIIWVQAEIANQIVRRDQLNGEREAYEETQTIVRTCQALRATFPPEWQHVDRWAHYDAKTASSVMMQSGHSYLVLRAQLPYLLKAKDHPDIYSSNALDCLQSCREILRRYYAVRTRLLTGAFLSRSFEVHAFTAAVIVILHGDKSWQNPMGDIALLENAKTAMMKAPKGEGSEEMAKQMIECLNALQRCLEGDEGAPERVRLRIPMLGGVLLRRLGENRVEVEVLNDVAVEEVEFDFDALDEEWGLRHSPSSVGKA